MWSLDYSEGVLTLSPSKFFIDGIVFAVQDDMLIDHEDLDELYFASS
jgi:hypothetical protein